MKDDNESKLPKKTEPFGDFFKSINHLIQDRPVKGILQSIDDFFMHPFPQASFPINVRETDDHHIVTAELAGVKKSQINIDILGNHLTIAINKQEIITEEDDNSKSYRHSESRQRSSRTIAFPHTIDEQQVKASYRDGLLKISIPKRRGKQIDIIE